MQRTRVTAYLGPKNLNWLKNKANNTGLSQSGIVNMLISQQRNKENFINKANRELETAQLTDLELTGE